MKRKSNCLATILFLIYLALLVLLYREEDMKMSENNDYIQLPPLKKDTPSDVIQNMYDT